MQLIQRPCQIMAEPKPLHGVFGPSAGSCRQWPKEALQVELRRAWGWLEPNGVAIEEPAGSTAQLDGLEADVVCEMHHADAWLQLLLEALMVHDFIGINDLHTGGDPLKRLVAQQLDLVRHRWIACEVQRSVAPQGSCWTTRSPRMTVDSGLSLDG